MTATGLNGWKAVRGEVERRIRTGVWAPGDPLPTEAALAREFGCARVTVNRALRALAEAGMLDRKRKAGTRVAPHPSVNATLRIPIIRREIEADGGTYDYRLIRNARGALTRALADRMGLARDAAVVHVEALHLADGRPYVFEDRWINLAAAPAAADADFGTISANEWLVTHMPFTSGDIAFFAANASAREARHLETAAGAALFVLERITRDADRTITAVRLSFAPGHRMRATV